jgi:hypothetical protein
MEGPHSLLEMINDFGNDATRGKGSMMVGYLTIRTAT